MDGVHDYPDLTEQTAEAAPLVAEPEQPWEETHPSLFDLSEIASEAYRLPDRTLLRARDPREGIGRESARVAETLVTALANFGIDATVVGEISGPRVTRYELQLAPGRRSRRLPR